MEVAKLLGQSTDLGLVGTGGGGVTIEDKGATWINFGVDEPFFIRTVVVEIWICSFVKTPKTGHHEVWF